MTANFKFDGGSELDTLRALQPNKPLHVTEYWPGWFDHWTGGGVPHAPEQRTPVGYDDVGSRDGALL